MAWRHARWLAFAAAMLVCAISAAPASAIMVKLPHGGYANYDAITGAKAPKAAKIFDSVFSNLDYSGGPIMPSNTNYVLEWLPSNYGGARFQLADAVGHVDYVTGMAKFLQDLAATSQTSTKSSVVDAVASQYNDTTGATSAYTAGYGGLLVDTDPLPANGCPVSSSSPICINDFQIQAELNTFLAARGAVADFTHEYFLITPPGVASCFDPSGAAGCSSNQATNGAYCAYHSRTGGLGYIYADVPDLSGDPGCDPFANTSNEFTCGTFPSQCPYNNGPADGMLSAVSHEHIESITDPEPNNAWTDWQPGCTPSSPITCGGEIGDKCNNDSFSSPNGQFGSAGNPYNQTLNGSPYLLQMEWSNQTNQCLDTFTPNGTTASASFTSASSGNTVNLDAGASSATGGVAEYVWQFNDKSGCGQNTTFETPGPTTSHTFPTGGDYTIALTVLAGDGTSYGTAKAVAVAPMTPTSTFAMSAPGALEGATLLFNGSGSTDPNACASPTYSWNFGDGAAASGPYASHAFHAGIYNVTLTVTDPGSGLHSSVAHQVSIIDEGGSAAFVAPSGRARSPVRFNGAGSDPDATIVSYSWSFGDNATGSGASASHSYARSGTYTVTLKVTDSNGQSSSAAHQVVIANSCIVPNIRGRSLSKARSALSSAHCGVGKVKSPKKPKKSPGKHKKWVLVVASESAKPGSSDPRGTAVRLNMTWKSVHN